MILKNLKVPETIKSIKGKQSNHNPVSPFNTMPSYWKDQCERNVNNSTCGEHEGEEHKMQRLSCLARQIQKWGAQFTLGGTRIHSKRP
jgi:hypothetical protein